MTETLALALSLAAGLLLGTFFFGGLLLTVRRGVFAKQPALVFVGSMVFRTAVTITGFYLVGGGDWQRLVACLLGFIIVRFIVIRITGRTVQQEDPATQKISHAP